MTESNINITVQLDTKKVPQQITWSATGNTARSPQKAKAMFIAFWDAIDKSALRIDLWWMKWLIFISRYSLPWPILFKEPPNMMC